MKCSKCGTNNPINVSKCIYCSASLDKPNDLQSNNNNVNNQPRDNKNSQTDSVIIGLIIALAAFLFVMVGVFAFNAMPRKGSFSGGGGGGGASAIGGPIKPGDIAVTLDGKDPDVEIHFFEADRYDILIGETRTVTFTAEVFENIVLSDTDVKVVDENKNEIGVMNDKGIDGDRVEGDGIYTLQKEFVADEQKNMLYYATAKDSRSDSINICYYRNFTREDYAAAEAIVSKLKELAQPHLNEDSTIDEDKLKSAMNDLSEYLDGQKTSGDIESYEINHNSIRIKLKEGYLFTYSIEVSGCAAGGSSVRVASYAPYDSLRGDMEPLYDEALDGTAQNIGNTFEGYTFNWGDNYDLNEVSLEALKNLSGQQVIIWGGHGGYDERNMGFGSTLMTGQLLDDNTTTAYSADITSERILTDYSAAGRRTYCISGGFFDKYLGRVNGAFVYLSACHSGQDMIDGKQHRYQLAQSFINKGAFAVVGNSESISSVYTYKMERDILNYMCEINEEGEGPTVSEAIEYAQGLNGKDDGSDRRARPMVFPQNKNTAINYRFANPKIGEISGAVKDAENRQAISDALVRVYKDGEEVASLRTDSAGYYSLNIDEGDYVLKITKGHYQSAKIAVSVGEGTTVYNETFLMLEVGIETGYANGTITDAVSGERVSGVSIKMRSNWNNKDGAIRHTTQTDENGYYNISYTPGFYTLEYSKAGYITGYKNIVVGAENSEAQNAVISPEMPEDGNFRIVLSWSNMPKDLDSHLTGPTVNGDRFHLYYKYANTNSRNVNSDYYQLDLDNIDIVSNPNVPETTTIVTQLDGVYRYSVHDYSNRGEAYSTYMAQSNATVNVYKGSVLVATYHVPPNAQGTIWTVFELSGDEIKPINKIGNGYEDDISKF